MPLLPCQKFNSTPCRRERKTIYRCKWTKRIPGEPEEEEVPPLPLSALPDVVQDGVEVHPPAHRGAGKRQHDSVV